MTQSEESEHSHIKGSPGQRTGHPALAEIGAGAQVEIDLVLLLDVAELERLFGRRPARREPDDLVGQAEFLGEVGEEVMDAVHGPQSILMSTGDRVSSGRGR